MPKCLSCSTCPVPVRGCSRSSSFAQYLRCTGPQSDNVLLCLMCEDYRIHSKRWIKALLVSLACIATTSPWAACCLERANLLRNSASVIFSLYTEESCVAGHASIANPYSQKGASRNVHPHYAGLSERCFDSHRLAYFPTSLWGLYCAGRVPVSDNIVNTSARSAGSNPRFKQRL